MGKITIPTGKTRKLADGSEVSKISLYVQDSSVRLAPRERLAESGKEVNPPSDVDLELEDGEDLFGYNTGASTAKIEVTPK